MVARGVVEIARLSLAHLVDLDHEQDAVLAGAGNKAEILDQHRPARAEIHVVPPGFIVHRIDAPVCLASVSCTRRPTGRGRSAHRRSMASTSLRPRSSLPGVRRAECSGALEALRPIGYRVERAIACHAIDETIAVGDQARPSLPDSGAKALRRACPRRRDPPRAGVASDDPASAVPVCLEEGAEGDKYCSRDQQQRGALLAGGGRKRLYRLTVARIIGGAFEVERRMYGVTVDDAQRMKPMLRSGV